MTIKYNRVVFTFVRDYFAAGSPYFILNIICYFKKSFRYLPKYINMNITFKALNDKTRREILELLKEQGMTAGEISSKFNISKPSISHHLDILKRAGLIVSEKKGQFVCYSLNTTILEDILAWIIMLKQENT